MRNLKRQDGGDQSPGRDEDHVHGEEVHCERRNGVRDHVRHGRPELLLGDVQGGRVEADQ